MAIDFKKLINIDMLQSKVNDFQDLEHIDGVALSTVSANLYDHARDDLVMFYFRDGANYASVFTQSKIVSENIKCCLLYTSPSPRDLSTSRMPSSA